MCLIACFVLWLLVPQANRGHGSGQTRGEHHAAQTPCVVPAHRRGSVYSAVCCCIFVGKYSISRHATGGVGGVVCASPGTYIGVLFNAMDCQCGCNGWIHEG